MISHIKLGKSKEAGSGQGSMLCKSRIFKIRQMKKKRKKQGHRQTKYQWLPQSIKLNKIEIDWINNWLTDNNIRNIKN